uniref:CCDC92 domain-containing protein n=1 Tax=Globodera pallida TaxID=36090 RepID=A0A183C7B5_GLOPA
MVPLNGAFGRLLCKFEVDQLERRLSFSLAQLDSLHAQINVITRHKERIERLLGEEREHFAKRTKGLTDRVLHLEAENSRLTHNNRQWTVSQQMDRSSTNEKKAVALMNVPEENSTQLHHSRVNAQRPDGQPVEDPFDGHQLRMPPLPKEDKKQIGIKPDLKNGVGEREDIGAEKDYIFAREKPREDLVFRRANGNNGTSSQLSLGKELMKKLSRKGKAHAEKTEREKAEGARAAHGGG